MRQLLFLSISLIFVACLDKENDRNTVKVLDTRKVDGTATTQVVSDSDFKALQDTVKALEAELTTLKSNTGSELTSIGSALTSLGSSVNGLSNGLLGIAKSQWLYDGNRVKRHKVISVYERDGWQQAVVEISPGVNTRYNLNRFGDTNAQQAPEKLDPSPPSGQVSIDYTLANCIGTPIIYDLWIGADYGQAGAVGNYFVSVTSGAQRFHGYTANSATLGITCSNGTSNLTGWGSAAIVQAISLFTYPNPLTVGP